MLLGWVVLCGLVVFGEGLPAFPNIGYLGAGYDIFFGNPHALGQVDPGFRPSVMQYSYNGETTADNLYALPDGVTVRNCEACAVSWDTQIVSGSSSYKQTLEVDVECDFKGYGASFSASTDYKQVQERTSQYKDVFTKSSATCSVYCAQMLPFGFNLDRVFVQGLSSLPQTYDKTKYLQFLGYFGTHVVTDLTMGGSFGQQSQILESSWTQMKDTTTKVKVSAGYSAESVSASVSVMTSDEISQAQQFSSHTESQRVYTVGGQPPSDGQASTWASQAITQPMPIRYTLQSMSDFLQSQVGSAVTSAVATNMVQALSDYCPALLAQGKLTSCDPPPPDPPLPGESPSCRMCVDSCGGDYPIESGAVSLDQNWPSWALDLASVCTPNTYGHNSYQNSIKLCCSSSSANTKANADVPTTNKLAPKLETNKQITPVDSEVCRFCVDSCGSSWPSEVGALSMDQEWDTFFAAHRAGCLDGYRTGSYSSGIKLCCQAQPVCAMCTTCGGDFTVEAGSWATDQGDWQNFFRDYGAGCAPGSYNNNGYADGVKLCCKT